MVIGAFPIAKLSVLLVKQISKPIANACKHRAKSHPFFRKYVCMPPAQFYNWCEVKAKMWILNLGKPVNIPVLSEAMAIELGANLLGETVIFAIGALLLVIEYQRQTAKESKKEEKRIAEMTHIQDSLRDIFFTVQHQQAQLKELERALYEATGTKPQDVPWAVPPPEMKAPVILEPEESEEGDEKATPGKPEGDGTQPKPDGQQTPAKDQPCPPIPTKCSYYSIRPFEDELTDMPYPNRGLILRSLNYIQIDVFSQTSRKSEAASNPEISMKFEQKPELSLVSTALADLESEFKTIF